MSRSAKNFFTLEQQQQILDAVEHAERETSGEIKVHIENSCKGDVLDSAAYIFKKLNIHKTELRNGVLFYLAIKHKKFAIIGDAGINSVVPPNFWDDVKENMLVYFNENKFTEGLCKGIEMAGEHLKKNFPYKTDDVNELSDDISFGK
jgi:uncharacterized membrane protein